LFAIAPGSTGWACVFLIVAADFRVYLSNARRNGRQPPAKSGFGQEFGRNLEFQIKSPGALAEAAFGA
jgi:hypothetical protein